MVAGHVAAAMAIKGRVPSAPMWALVVSAVLLDMLNPAFRLAGVEGSTVTDWSHSLAMSVV